MPAIRQQQQYQQQQLPYQYDSPMAAQMNNPYGNGSGSNHNHNHNHNTGHNGHGGDMQQQSQSPVPMSGQMMPMQNTPTSNGNISDGGGVKGNRLRKACDSCSIRKVKCDESGIPCRACAALDIPCTFKRPSRRRGPPNRHAEAIKKKVRLESPSGSFSSPSSPSNVAATLAHFASSPTLSAQAICPISTLQLLVDDFFTYIHPLCPFPHEPSFRNAFKDREDVRNPKFLALLASMVGVLVASFPRKPRQHLKAEGREHLFPSSVDLVERCHKVAVSARGPGYLDSDLSVHDAATSYFLGLAAAYTFKWKLSRLYFGETLTIIRVLGAHKVHDNKVNDNGLRSGVGGMPLNFTTNDQPFIEPSAPVDYIRQEIGRRVFWMMFVGVVSIRQLGAQYAELSIPPPTSNCPYPPFPLEVDDEYIHASHIEPQPAGKLSKLVGFNINVRIYQTVTPLSTMELAYGIDEVFDWTRQKSLLDNCLRNVKQVMNEIPPDLQLQPGSQPGEFGETSLYAPSNFNMSDLSSNGIDTSGLPQVFEERRRIQFEIQKANIYLSQLGTRSWFVDKYCNLQEAYNMKINSEMGSPALGSVGLDSLVMKAASSNPEIETNVTAERESIVVDLFMVLGSISQVNMEPNGGSFINKIRQIASTLIESSDKHKGPLALKSEEYLSRFVAVLVRLEGISPGKSSSGTNEEEQEPRSEEERELRKEEEELRNWADLRQYQMAFAQSGGFLSEG
ncbi:hypothetical protein LZ554_006459 [Drepanopeziza brunnea f. sp. 'monogermtubi']|nr:hypothetical protein LZ554_006459 [Drepanopeziza brunnea f. sp. 'monogermtubi']